MNSVSLNFPHGPSRMLFVQRRFRAGRSQYDRQTEVVSFFSFLLFVF